QKQWQDFGHELGHVLCHAGHQLKMNHMFLKYQEWKANNFMYHFCVPTFMLYQLKEVNVHNVMDLFNVEHEFACKRLASFSFKKHIIKTH
ncbi:MAG TPA: ImmA/IrrE family metallo-endopeptidase, partial [Bacillota bacterium]|nr:ImmA/IrrE family metallo-endopeptidase [Bacillota bacterium]